LNALELQLRIRVFVLSYCSREVELGVQLDDKHRALGPQRFDMLMSNVVTAWINGLGFKVIQRAGRVRPDCSGVSSPTLL
jgi:hypothetical protein